MLCQKCGKKPATTFIKRTINGKTTEIHLCADCAAEKGIGHALEPFGFDFGDFWGSLFAEPEQRELAETVHCNVCGSTFRQISQTGKVGCPSCYITFYDQLLPSIQRIHGKTKHIGKIPSDAPEKINRAQELEALRRQLSDNIASQNYEACASLRDQIQKLEKEDEDHAG